jgi:hypothetical protein
MKKRHEQKLIILSIFLLATFNLPFILMMDKADAFLGLPLIYLYIFSLWLFAVLVSMIIIRRYGE